MKEDIIHAHEFSANHKDQILKDTYCGCFYCLKIFKPSEIKEWIKDKTYTAICPYCGIDAIIGESSGYSITGEFLSKMKSYWF